MKKIDTRCKDLGKRYSTVQQSGMDEECEREPEREVEQKKRHFPERFTFIDVNQNFDSILY